MLGKIKSQASRIDTNQPQARIPLAEKRQHRASRIAIGPYTGCQDGTAATNNGGSAVLAGSGDVDAGNNMVAGVDGCPPCSLQCAQWDQGIGGGGGKFPEHPGSPQWAVFNVAVPPFSVAFGGP